MNEEKINGYDRLKDEKPLSGIIVLDGADGTGKTTLAKEFTKMFGGDYIHLTWSEEIEKNMDSYILEKLKSAIKTSQTKLVIIDRLWISEALYSLCYRNATKWNGMHLFIDFICKENKVLNILCIGEQQKVLARFDKLKSERVEMYENIENVVTAYNALWAGGYAGLDFKSEYINHIANSGGLCLRNDFIKYDIEHEGKDLRAFCNYAKDCLTSL